MKVLETKSYKSIRATCQECGISGQEVEHQLCFLDCSLPTCLLEVLVQISGMGIKRDYILARTCFSTDVTK